MKYEMIEYKPLIITFILALLGMFYLSLLIVNTTSIPKIIITLLVSVIVLNIAILLRNQYILKDPLALVIQVWIILSFLAQYILTNINKANYKFGTFNQVGRFDFTDQMYISLTLVVVMGVCGVVLALFVGIAISKYLKSIVIHCYNKKSISKKYLLNFYIIFNIILMLIAFKSGIGIMTQKIEINSGIPIIGLYVYYRNIMMPIFLYYLLDCSMANDEKIRRGTLLLLLVLILVFTVTAASKKGMIFIILPAILHAIIYRRLKILNIIKILMIFLFLFLIFISLVTAIRTTHYQQVTFSFELLLFVFSNIELLDVLNAITRRLVGLQDLMTVVSYEGLSLEFFLNPQNLNSELWGFNDNGQIKSLAVSMFGYYFFTGNYLIVLIGSFFTFLPISYLVSSLRRQGWEMLSTGVCIVLFFNAFGGITLQYFKFVLPLTLISIFVINTFDRLTLGNNHNEK